MLTKVRFLTRSMRSRLLFLFLILSAQNICPQEVIKIDELVWRGPAGKNYIALTFDDGPGTDTKDVLEVLARHNAKATFFMLGISVKMYPGQALEVYKAGQLIANHTQSHLRFKKMPPARRVQTLIKEIDSAESAIKEAVGVKTDFLRLPYGISRPWVRTIAQSKRYILANWTYCANYKLNKEEQLKGYLDNLKPGMIFLLHDGRNDKSIAAWLAENILIEAEKKGLASVRLDDFLGIDLEKLNNGAGIEFTKLKILAPRRRKRGLKPTDKSSATMEQIPVPTEQTSLPMPTPESVKDIKTEISTRALQTPAETQILVKETIISTPTAVAISTHAAVVVSTQ
ncbi:MAG: polysaccharide deacetylase family protein, partial [Elusimicrobia bacterium]|nr:polysaccharide deacetylase family protein [Elusimicrobiota bacterium]